MGTVRKLAEDAMKTLFLLRHAKSSWDDPATDDFDRPLSARGRRAAPRIALYMAAHGLVPAAIMSSPARRSVETVEALRPALGRAIPLAYADRLYLATPETLLALVHALPDSQSPVLIVGHNPGMEELAARLSGAGPARPLARLRDKFPTAALAVIALPVARWADTAAGSGTLTHFVRPNDLDDPA